MNKRLIGKLLLAAVLLIMLYAYHFGAQRDLKKEIGRGYHINMVHIATALSGLDYEKLTGLSTEGNTYGSLDKLYITLRYSELQSYEGLPEVYSLLSNTIMLISDYKHDGALSQEKQEEFNANVQKINAIVTDLEQLLDTDLDWYDTFTNPHEKVKERIEERLEMEE